MKDRQKQPVLDARVPAIFTTGAVATPAPKMINLGEFMAAADFIHVRGQEACKRALHIAIVGCHSVVMYGPSGHGKTMMATATRAIEPRVNFTEVTTPTTACNEFPNREEYAWCGDIHIEVPQVSFRELFSKRPGTDSAYMTKKCKEARDFASQSPIPNLTLSDGCICLAKQAYEELGISPRSLAVIIRIARTIANLECAADISETHLAEAIQYRLLDRKF